MHVLLNPIGSAGDVHPFVGLGLGLRARGHRVTFLVSPHFRPLLERLGFESIDLGTEADFRAALEDPDLWHPTRSFGVVARSVLASLPLAYEAIAARYVPGETAVVAGSLAYGARVAHDRLGVPLAMAHLQPSFFRSLDEFPVYPGVPLSSRSPRFAKRLFYRAVDALVIDRHLGPGLNAFRAGLGLPAVSRSMDGWLHAPQLVLGLFPDWFGPPQPDWPPQTRLVGFPLYDERDAADLDDHLAAFLDAGEPPIVFTPGSANLFGRAFFEEAVGACGRLGRRGLLLTRHAEQVPADLPPEVRHVPFVPFSRLLPRAAALVHHGGVGTMAQAFAAGIPQLVRPLAHDQFDNADRARRLGVALAIVPKRFRAPAVADALARLIDSPEVRSRCRDVAARFEGVDPVADACGAIEAALCGSATGAGPGATAGRF